MAKGISIKFKSYEETVPKLLKVIKLDQELKNHNKIVIKPFVRDSESPHTDPKMMEQVIKFCLEHKKPESEVLIAEGSDGEETTDLYDSLGYKALAEKYSIGLVDLNHTDVEEMINADFLKFEKIQYPTLLLESFVISVPPLSLDENLEMVASLTNMIGVFPGDHYSGIFSRKKSKLRKWPLRYSIHDVIKCKMPHLAIIDASNEYNSILAGQPLEIDKQAAKLVGKEWKSVSYLRLLAESFDEKDQ